MEGWNIWMEGVEELSLNGLRQHSSESRGSTASQQVAQSFMPLMLGGRWLPAASAVTAGTVPTDRDASTTALSVIRDLRFSASVLGWFVSHDATGRRKEKGKYEAVRRQQWIGIIRSVPRNPSGPPISSSDTSRQVCQLV
jgi:hypothetical protein